MTLEEKYHQLIENAESLAERENLRSEYNTELRAEIEAMTKLKNIYYCAFHEQREDYEKALTIIEKLVSAYGCKTPKWEEARNLLDIERPLIKEKWK